MKKNILILVVLGTIAILGSVLVKNVTNARASNALDLIKSISGKGLRKTELSIEGMWCTSCATGAEFNLKEIDGVVDAYVGFTEELGGQGWVIYEKGKVTEEQIIKAIEPYETTVVSDSVYTK